MTRPSEELKQVQKIALFFDICNSTTILEDLLRSENVSLWRNVLISLKNFLRDCEKTKWGQVLQCNIRVKKVL